MPVPLVASRTVEDDALCDGTQQGGGTVAEYPEGYTFSGGYPTAETIQRAYDDADLS